VPHLPVIDLHFDDDWDIPESEEHVAKPRDPHSTPSKRVIAGGIDPPVSGIDPRELGRGETIDRSGAIRGPVERRVVAYDDDSIGGKMHVEFQPVRAGCEPTLKRGHSVLGPKRAASSMREDSGLRRSKEGHA